MNRVMIPNSFQVPNFLVDKLLPEFTGAETKVAIFIMAKAAENMTNVVNLSLADIAEGCGLAITSVNEALVNLVSHEFIFETHEGLQLNFEERS